MATKYTGSNEGAEGLRVRDQDGTPNVKPVTEIRVTNGTLTDDGNGVISLQTGGGGGGSPSSGPAGAVQLSDGAGGFVNDTDFNFDTTNNRLELGDSALGTESTAVPGAATVVIHGASVNIAAADTQFKLPIRLLQNIKSRT